MPSLSAPAHSGDNHTHALGVPHSSSTLAVGCSVVGCLLWWTGTTSDSTGPAGRRPVPVATWHRPTAGLDPDQDSALAALRDGAIRRRRGLPASTVSAAASLLHMIRAAISRVRRRVQSTKPEQLTAGICCSSWLTGRHPFITAQQFGSTWALHGVLCSVSQGNTLLVHLSLTSPVYFTGSGVGGGPMAGLV